MVILAVLERDLIERIVAGEREEFSKLVAQELANLCAAVMKAAAKFEQAWTSDGGKLPPPPSAN